MTTPRELADRLELELVSALREEQALSLYDVVFETLDEAVTMLRALADQQERDAKDAERLKALRELCGYVENGSHTSVSISQDDATRDWVIYVGGKYLCYGPSFYSAIDAARAAQELKP